MSVKGLMWFSEVWISGCIVENDVGTIIEAYASFPSPVHPIGFPTALARTLKRSASVSILSMTCTSEKSKF